MDRFYAILKRDDNTSLRAIELALLMDRVLTVAQRAIPKLNAGKIVFSGCGPVSAKTTKEFFEHMLSSDSHYMDIQFHSADEILVLQLGFHSADRSVATIYCQHPTASKMLDRLLPHFFFEKLKVGHAYFHSARENWDMRLPKGARR